MTQQGVWRQPICRVRLIRYRELICYGGLIYRRSVIVLMLLILMGCASVLMGCTPEQSASSSNSNIPQTMKLTSPAFSSNGLIPAQYTCDGENHSPVLSWDAPPSGARSLVLIVDDPDAPRKIFTHWVLYDLPPETRQLPEKIPAQPFLDIGGLQGKNDFGQYGYGGPCPPNGTHRYLFQLFALDQIMDLPPGTTKAELLKAMEGHALARAELIGQYRRQK